MATAYLIEWPRIKQEQYEILVRALNWYGKILSGTAVHVPGPKGSFIVLDVWESREASDHFLASLFAQALHKAGLPQPVIQAWQIAGLQEPAIASSQRPDLLRNEGPAPKVKRAAGRLRLSTFSLN